MRNIFVPTIVFATLAFGAGAQITPSISVENAWARATTASAQAAAEKVANSDPDVRTAISAIKVFVPAAYHRVVDRAIQVWGGAGVSNDLPLAQMYLTARVLRLADGPDEVHKILIAKNILHRYESGDSWNFGN